MNPILEKAVTELAKELAENTWCLTHTNQDPKFIEPFIQRHLAPVDRALTQAQKYARRAKHNSQYCHSNQECACGLTDYLESLKRPYSDDPK